MSPARLRTCAPEPIIADTCCLCCNRCQRGAWAALHARGPGGAPVADEVDRAAHVDVHKVDGRVVLDQLRAARERVRVAAADLRRARARLCGPPSPGRPVTPSSGCRWAFVTLKKLLLRSMQCIIQ
jgi:hypothetical protein